jgi:dTDP-4-amino-4,6-dideoxygalactose transaminase
VRDGCTHAFHVYSILHAKRDAVRAALQAVGIGCGVYYPTPAPLQPCYAHLGHKPGDFPVAERLSAESLALPMFPEISPAQIRTVAGLIERL